MNFELPKIYPITDRRLTKISHCAQVEKLIAGGAKLIQLREKYAAPQEFYEDVKNALRLARQHGVKTIINDRVDIALALKADGVHLGQNDLPPEEARKILGAKAIIGFSTHTIEQAISAVKLPINYIAIGPIFPTKTKENPDEIVGIEAIKMTRRAVGGFPLVAIGGITAKNLRAVFDAGADSAAIISDLLTNAEQIAERLQILISATKIS